MTTIPPALARAVQYHQAGNLAQAEQIYRQLLQANPADANALHLLGMLAHQRGQHEAALDLIHQAVAILPQVAEFRANLAGIFMALGRWEEAVASCGQALRLRPDMLELHCNLGDALAGQRKWEEAFACYRQALVLQPTYAEAHHKLGLALAEQGRVEEALASYREALRLRPDLHEVHNNLGNTLKQIGRLEEAEASYREALRLGPDNADILSNLGAALAEQGQFAEAEASYRQALFLRPDLAEAHYNLGAALAAQGKQDEAQAACEQAVRIQPDYAMALGGLGNAYKDQGRLDEAITCYKKAIAASPDVPYLHSNLLFALHYHANYDPENTFAEHLRWGGQFGTSPPPHRPLHPIHRDPRRRLRVGYVSGDFRHHVMGTYSEAIIAAHDRGQVEVFCYANVAHADALTERIKASADHWRSVVGLPDGRVAELVLEDRIDLLVDLAGHSGGNRLGVFTKKPAPIQVTHCGYPATTGLAAIDYRLTDPYCDPPGRTEHLHREKLVRLPRGHWCFAPPPGPAVSPLPARRSAEVTFGSFNSLCKVTEPMIGLWSEILRGLPRSRMVMKTGGGSAGDKRVRAAFSAHGAGDERVTLVGRQQDYFKLYQDVDICLDTYPYTGCNITGDALWMGVPVVSLAGASCVTRQGVAALVQVGLEDLVTETPAAYVEAAIRLAEDLPRLQQLRGQLRERLERSVGDVQRFTRDLEAAYRGMWERFCRGE